MCDLKFLPQFQDVKVFSSEIKSFLPPKIHAFTVHRNKVHIFREEEVMLEADFFGQKIPPKTSSETPSERPPKGPSQSGKVKRLSSPVPEPTTGYLDASDPTILARQLGVRKTKLIQKESEVLNKAPQKDTKEGKLNVLRQMVPTIGYLDASDPTTLARQLGVRKTKLIQKESEVLNKAPQKDTKEGKLNVLRQMVLDENLNLAEQHFLVHHTLEESGMRKERRREKRNEMEGREMEMREDNQKSTQKIRGGSKRSVTRRRRGKSSKRESQ